MISEFSKEKLLFLLMKYGISEIGEYKMVDSSHGEDDVRHNYIIDKRYVLRVNSAPVMTEGRLSELNALIERYKAFGLRVPYFIPDKDGHFLHKEDGNLVYLSEYLDLSIADDYIEKYPEKKEGLKIERLIMISAFAEKYKDCDLIDTPSMYSMFDLAPYDIPYGVDDKEQNLDALIKDLLSYGETALVSRLKEENARIRGILYPIYKGLPHCVFQGDENFSNLCVDEDGNICGLFDFNMSGVDVNANYLANVAFLGRFVLDDDVFDHHDVGWVYEEILRGFWLSTDLIRKHYHFTDEEYEAYLLYAKMVMFSGWANASTFLEFLKKPAYYAPTIELIERILKWNGER